MLDIISWIAFGLTVVSVVLSIFKSYWTWVIGFASNAVWYYYANITHQPALMVCQLIFIPLNIWGFIAWRKK